MPLRPKGETTYDVVPRLDTDKIATDTTRSELATGSELPIAASFRHRTGSPLVFEPLLLGGPTLHPAGEVAFDEFSKVIETPVPADIAATTQVSDGALIVPGRDSRTGT